MSKIYEALLRAEMERVSQQNQDGSATTLPRWTTPEAVEPIPLPVETTRAEASRLGTMPAMRLEAWRPDEVRLPALDSRGATVEQIRALRSKLNQFRLDMPLKKILISSGQPAEGKSFVAANLAISLASRSGRTLLIDGDMRRGTLHKLLGAPSSPGLTEYLAGIARLRDVLQGGTPESVRNMKGLGSLCFIGCGEDADNAADLSVNGRFQHLLEEVQDSFDWIVVDSSPVNLVADGVNLALACDSVILVTRAEVTKYEVAQRALQELKSAKVLGVVLNALKDAAPTGGYYGYDK